MPSVFTSITTIQLWLSPSPSSTTNTYYLHLIPHPNDLHISAPPNHSWFCLISQQSYISPTGQSKFNRTLPYFHIHSCITPHCNCFWPFSSPTNKRVRSFSNTYNPSLSQSPPLTIIIPIPLISPLFTHLLVIHIHQPPSTISIFTSFIPQCHHLSLPFLLIFTISLQIAFLCAFVDCHY